MTVIRDLTAVIAKMLADIPVDQLALRSALQHVSDRAIYTAPEIMHHRWQDCQRVLNQHLPDSDNLSDWQRKVVAVWMNK